MYIYIYICCAAPRSSPSPGWLRTNDSNGVNTNGVVAKVMMFCQIAEKGTPWHFWEDKSRLRGVTQKSLCQTNMKFAVNPLVLTPFVPFRLVIMHTYMHTYLRCSPSCIRTCATVIATAHRCGKDPHTYRRRENMVGVNMVLAEYHQIQHGYYKYVLFVI